MTRYAHVLLLALLGFALTAPPAPADARRARTAYKAVKKKVSKKFAKRGTQRPRRQHGSAAKKKPNRYGNDGDYYALSRKRALSESTSRKRLPTRAAVRRAGAKVDMYRGKVYRSAMKKRVNVNSLSNKQLKAMTGLKSLRGCKKRGVIGPKAGQRLGKWANKHKRVLRYQPRARVAGEKSTRGKWGNLYVPYSMRPPNAAQRGAAVSKLKRM